MSFVHLRAHTSYSLLEGALTPRKLASVAFEHEMPAIAVCDTHNLFGVMEVGQCLSEKGIQPIPGCSLLVEFPGSVLGEVGFIVRSEVGYKNLLALISDAYMGGADLDGAVVKLDALRGRCEGLFLLSGNHKGIAHKLMAMNKLDLLREYLSALSSVVPGGFFIELQRVDAPHELRIEQELIAYAYDAQLPLVATNDIYYATPSSHDAHDALRCIAQGEYLEDASREVLAPCHFFRSASEMMTLFADLPEACENTLAIAQSCGFFPGPRDPILPRFVDGGVDAENEELERQALDGLRRRLAKKDSEVDEKLYADRLLFELKIIQEKGFAGYFLIVADFIKWAKEQAIPVGPGRGSGAGSLVAWSLTITDLDPLEFGLLFERFLNPERRSMPDFDVDFCQDRRDEVIQYVQERYGSDQVAQIITFGKLQARAVLRDVGRVMGMPYGQVDRICKLVPNNPANPVTLQQALDEEEALRLESQKDEQTQRLFDISLQLEGLYRHASTHAAGVVIGDRPLKELIPLYRDPKSTMPVTQFNMNWAETAGMVKFDFLGLKTLTVIATAIKLIAEKGINIDIQTIPMDDKKTFSMLGLGHSTGVFQLESSGMRDVLRKMQPDCLEDIIALVSLYRPGPMDNIPRYIECKSGRAEPDYLHPILKPILEETYGVIIYQEQVMQIAQVMSGYSLGEADLLRRAMGKKKKDVMAKEHEKFVARAVERGIDAHQAGFIFNMVEKFAGYGFNKSHAAAYALIAYQTAYLKANYPLEFLAALMTLDLGNTDKLAIFCDDVRLLGFDILPPHVNHSLHDFSTEDGKLRYAMGAVRNVGSSAIRWFINDRNNHGPFKDFDDLVSRLHPESVNKRAFEYLARAGAFSDLGVDQATILGSIDLIFSEANRIRTDELVQQANMFADAGSHKLVLRRPSRQLTDFERLEHEHQSLGFFLSGHPLDAYREQLDQEQVGYYKQLVADAESGPSKGLVAGLVVSVQERKGQVNRFGIVKFSDKSGSFEVPFFSDVWTQSKDKFIPGEVLVLFLQVEWVDGQPKVRAESVRPLERSTAHALSRVELLIDDPSALRDLRQVLQPGGCEVFIRHRCGEMGCETLFQLPARYNINIPTRHAILAIHGIGDLRPY